MEAKSKLEDTYTFNKDRLGTRIVIAAKRTNGEVKVDPDALRAALRAGGVPADIVDLVRDPDAPHVRLRRAVGNAKKGMKEIEDGRSMRFDWSHIGKKDGVSSYALVVIETTMATAHWQGQQVATVSVSKTGNFNVDLNGNGSTPQEFRDEADRITDRYKESGGKLNSVNVREFINEACLGARKGARTLGSVAYILPKGDDEDIMKMKDALDSVADYGMSPNSVMPHDAAGMRRDVEDGILQAIAALAGQVSHSVRQSKEGSSSMRPSTFDKRLAEAVMLRDKAQFYASLMGVGMERVQAAYAEAEKLIVQTQREVIAKMVAL